MRVLFIGDIVGKPGRLLVRRALPGLAHRYDADLVIANAENAAAGRGITAKIGAAILETGVDVMTSGNHVWDQREAVEYIAVEPRLLRPANFPAGVPGTGHHVARSAAGHAVGVVNVMGRVFMVPLDNPFEVVLEQIERVQKETSVIVVDFHAEATSEKIAMGWHLDGRVTAVVGTHTHVQTADEQILPGGTAYITDVGMTGPHDSIIGVEKEAALGRFLNSMPARFEPATGRPLLHAVLITADPDTGKATAIERLSLSASDIDAVLAREVPVA